MWKFYKMVIVSIPWIIIAMVDWGNPNLVLFSRVTIASFSHWLSACSDYTLIPTVKLYITDSRCNKMKTTLHCHQWILLCFKQATFRFSGLKTHDVFFSKQKIIKEVVGKKSQKSGSILKSSLLDKTKVL